MDDITSADVLELAPELTTVSAEAWVWILAYVSEVDLTFVSDTENTTQILRIYLAAHMATITTLGSSSSSAAAGPVTSESAGGIRRSYATIATSTVGSDLTSTRYGQRYTAILRSSLASGPFLV